MENQTTENPILSQMAEAYGMTEKDFRSAVITQCFADGAASNAQILMLLSAARKYDLNPLMRELHAFVNPKRNNKMEITVGVDGWFKIVARDPRVLGWEDEEERDEKGELIAVTVRIYRSDRRLADGRYLPGKYRAKMEEWLVEHQPNKAPTNWEEMPEHRLYGVAFKEAARRTLGITELIGEVDEAKIVHAEAVVVTPVVEQPKEIEHQPAVPMQDFRNGEQREAVPAGNLHVVPDVSAAISETTASATIACQQKDCRNDATGFYKTKAGEFCLCEEHRAQHEVKPRGRPPKVDGGGVVAGKKKEAAAASQSGGGTAVRDSTVPPSSPATAAAKADSGVVQQAKTTDFESVNAGSNPASGALESFIATHGVPAKRVNLALSKYGATDLGRLSDEQKSQILAVFKRSYANA